MRTEHQLDVVAAVSRAVGSSLQVEEVMQETARAVIPGFADWCTVDMIEPSGRQEIVVAHVDPLREPMARELTRRYQAFRRAHSPLEPVFTAGQTRYIADYGHEQAQADGLSADEMELLAELRPCSVISVQMAGRHGSLGVMSFLQSDSGRHFSPEDVRTAEALADRAALALENARLYRETRRAEERQRFLANVASTLNSSLHYQRTLDELARLAVPTLGDWCTVDISEEGRPGHSLAIAHVDPGKVRLARELQERWPADLSEPRGVGNVIRTGEPELYADLPADMLTERAKGDEEHMRILEALGPWTSALIVPLRARGRTFGALTLIAAESGRHYAQDDVDFALDVADRAALAVDNARLYAAERQARIEAERLQALAQRLGQSLAVEEVLHDIANMAAELIEAPVAGVFLLDASGEYFELVAGFGFDALQGQDLRLPRARSAAGHIIESSGAVIINDVRTAHVTALPQLVSGSAIGSLIVAPIVGRSEPLGVIELYSPEVGQFLPRQAELVSTLAATAATALENARSYSAEQRARSEAQQLQVLTEQLGRSLAPEQVLDQIAGMAAELLHSPVAGVFLVDQTGEFFELVAARGLDLGTMRLPWARSLAGQVAVSGRAATVVDARQAPITALPELLSGEPVGSLVVAPIITQSGTSGVVEVYSTEVGAFGQHDAELLTSLAGAAAIVLDNARLYRQRELDLNRLQTIVDQLPVAVLVVEAESGAVTVRNKEAQRLYGSALDRMHAGRTDRRRGRHADGSAYQAADWPLARALKGEYVTAEHMDVDRPDGGRSHLTVNAAPLVGADGAITAAVAVHADVTGELELRRQKDQFLAAAAHDLKTPMTTIRGLTQLLMRQLGRPEPPQPERTRTTLAGIETGTRRMTGLIDELLDISRMDTVGTLSLSRRAFDMVAVVRQVIAEQQLAAPLHSFVLETGFDSLVGNWDEARLERAVSNLLTNAVKYSPDGGQIRITIGREDEDDGSWAVVSVRDSGIGIPAGDVERIFERFLRGSNVPERLAGSGVGLAYVRQIVEQHGGQVTVQSQVGEGSTFTLRLPLAGS